MHRLAVGPITGPMGVSGSGYGVRCGPCGRVLRHLFAVFLLPFCVFFSLVAPVGAQGANVSGTQSSDNEAVGVSSAESAVETAQPVTSSQPGDDTLTAEPLLDRSGDDAGAGGLDLITVVKRVLRVNLDRRLQEAAVRVSSGDVGLARGALLPKASVGANVTWIDSDRGYSSFGSNAQYTLNLTARASLQLINEPAWASLSVAQKQRLAAERLEDSVRLDVIANAITLFLNVLRAEVNADLEEANLRSTARFLKRAKIRNRTGAGGVADVHRLESQLEGERARWIMAKAEVERAKVDVNRAMQRGAERPVSLVMPRLDDPRLTVHFVKYATQLSADRGLRLYRDYVSQRALAVAPEVKRADAMLMAAKRAKKSASRAFWIPILELTGSISHLTLEAGRGADNVGQGNFVSFGDPDGDGMENGFPVLVDRTNFDVVLQATYPLFDGARRFAEVSRSKHLVEQERLRKEQLALDIDAQVRSAVRSAWGAYESIEHSESAAEASTKNLEIITRRYESGADDITTLLDAQRNALSANLSAAVARIDFLSSYYNVQRRSGRFDLLEGNASKREWEQGFRVFYGERAKELDNGSATATYRGQGDGDQR